MKSKKTGKATLKAEILNISKNGLWLLVNDQEYFLSYKDFPWFQNGKVSEVFDVKMKSKSHLYWPQMDVDLELESFTNLEKYPLIYHK